MKKPIYKNYPLKITSLKHHFKLIYVPHYSSLSLIDVFILIAEKVVFWWHNEIKKQKNHSSFIGNHLIIIDMIDNVLPEELEDVDDIGAVDGYIIMMASIVVLLLSEIAVKMWS